MRRLAFRLVGDDAEDVLQESYVSAFRAYPRFRGNSRFETWMYRIVYNTCLGHLRRRRPPLVEDPDPDLDFVAGNDTAGTATDRVDLATALDRLSPAHRAAVLLVDAEGLAFAEAAEVLGIPEGTLASRLGRARSRLRDHLREVDHG